MKNGITYHEYQKLSDDEQRLHDFEMLQRIYKQVVSTNGRVTKLELWRSLITGGLIVIGIIVIPLFLDSMK